MGHVGERILNVRKKEGLTQTELAKIIGSSQTALVDYEKGVRDPPMSALVAFCKHFQRRPEWLLLGEGPESSEDQYIHLREALRVTNCFLRPLLKEPNPATEAQFTLLAFRYLTENGEISDSMAEELSRMIAGER